MIKYGNLSNWSKKNKKPLNVPDLEARRKRKIQGEEQDGNKKKGKKEATLPESSSDREKIGSKQNRKWKGERTSIYFKMYKSSREYPVKHTMQSRKYYSLQYYHETNNDPGTF